MQNVVLDAFQHANVKIKHQNHIHLLIKVISGDKNFTSGFNMSLPVSQKSLPVPSELLSTFEVNLGHFRCLLSPFKDHLKDDSQVVRRGSGATPQGHQFSNLMALRLQFQEKYV